MIKKIEKKDFERVYELGRILHPTYETLYPLEEMLKENFFNVIVYEDKGDILGFLSYTDLKVTLDILDVVVDEKHRRKHVAANLIDYVITGSTPGCEIFIEVYVNNKAAISLYEKFGFEIIGKREKYYNEEDAYLMKRVI